MSKLLKRERLEQENSEQISQIAKSLGSKKGTISLDIYFGGGTTMNAGFYGLTSTGFWIAATWRVTDNMSDSDDMKIIMTCRERFAATNPSGTYDIGATKTDLSEAFQTTNIANGTAWSIGGSPNLTQLAITVAHADFDQDDLLYFYLETDSNFDLDVFDISIEYTEA